MTTKDKQVLLQDICERLTRDVKGRVVAETTNVNHFNYRGLVEKGLVLNAPEGSTTIKIL